MSSLSESANKTPLKYLLATVLLVGAIISVPIDKILLLLGIKETVNALFIANTIVRLIGVAVFGFLFYKFGFINYIKEFNLKGLIVVILPLLVAINNFPFIAHFKGLGVITEKGITIILYLVWCLSVALLEELAFRGIVYPLIKIKLEQKGTKNPVFWSIALQGLIFGGMHLLNIFGSNPLAVLLQIGYSFLTGSMFAITLLYTKNLAVPIILHFIYNACGLFYDHLGSLGFENHWNLPTIIITAVLAVITITFMVFAVIKKEKKEKDEKFRERI
ncbi:MAG: CPBP family intramembrane metalloprotease [Clostridia bacterium]|nr:CPBP family intramembrane metalloprotease [Clostridia bacterium]